MLNEIIQRVRQGHRTAPYPRVAPTLPERLRGLPVLDVARCTAGCRACVDACPTGAIVRDADHPAPRVDLGRCLFCPECSAACPSGALRHSTDHRLATRQRSDLLFGGDPLALAKPLEGRLRSLYSRSLKLRQVSAAGCNGCEADINVLGTLVFDLGRFGIQVVASPRHADGLLVTGPVSQNMALALQKTYDSVPAPKLVIAVGACAIAGGPYIGHPEVRNGVESMLPVDLFIPGCPPHPYTILDGLLRLVGRLEEKG